jgi:hypothetical protein
LFTILSPVRVTIDGSRICNSIYRTPPDCNNK